MSMGLFMGHVMVDGDDVGEVQMVCVVVLQ